MRRETPHVLVWSVLTAALLVTAYLLIDTTFMFYDDEGYVLLGLRNYLAGNRLYDEIFSQYGPWPYVYHQLITTVLQHPLTHMLGRMLTTFHWVASVLLCGVLAQRLTGRISMAAAATLTAFGLLWQMSAEPSHPGSMISLLVALAVIAGTQLAEPRRTTAAAGAIGAIACLLCLTKINVGLLLVAGAGCAALRFTDWPERWRTPADVAGVAGLLAVPWVLIAKKLGDPWALTFALQFTAGAAGLLWVTPAAWTGRPLRPRTIAAACAGFVAAGLVVLAVVWWHGSSLSAILTAVLITPLKQPANFSFGFTWLGAVWPVAAGAWLLAGFAGWEMRRHNGISRPVRGALIATRLAVLFVFAYNALAWLTIYGVGRFIVFCLPLLPVFLVPLRPRESTDAARAHWLAAWCAALLALPQVLHAFPVAGSQMGWGTFMLVPFFIAGLHEAWVSLEELVLPTRRWLAPAGAAALLVINGYQFWLLADNGWERYRTSRPLGLPGAEDLRLEGPARLALRTLTLNASIHADVLFSRPGMFSYNLWSGVPTPTLQNATHWFWLLDEAQQRKIIEQLQAAPRSAIITNRPLDEFMERINVPMTGPLIRHIAEAYEPLFRLRDFTFLVPRGHQAVPFGKIEVLGKAQAESDGRQPVLLRTNIALDGQPVGITLERASYPWGVQQNFTGRGLRIYLEPINSAGLTFGPVIELPVAHPLHGLFRLSIFCDDAVRITNPSDAVLRVTGPSGAVLSESIL